MNDNSKKQNPSKPKILYLRPSAGAIPLNALTAKLLKREFSDHEVHVVDIRDLVKSSKLTIAMNVIATLWLYSSSLIRRRKRLRQCFWRTPYIFRCMSKLIRNKYADQNWTFTFQIQSLFDGSLDGIPHYVYTDHTHLANLSYPGFDESKLFSRKWIACEGEIYKNATAVFTMSNNMSRSVVDDYGVNPDQVYCVYSGPNIEIKPEKHIARNDDGVNVLFVGVDWQRKGGDLLVKAFSQLKDDYPSLHITVVGCIPSEADDFDGRIVVKGRVPIDEVGREFASADVFCMPTRLEPFGIVFIEAMAHSLPIVSTRVGALPDMVLENENGLLVDSDDAEALAAAIKVLLDDSSLRDKMGSRGYERYMNTFNWTSVYSRIRERIAQTTAI